MSNAIKIGKEGEKCFAVDAGGEELALESELEQISEIWECEGCGSRYDNKDEAEDCCEED